MNHEFSAALKYEPNDLEEIASRIRTDGEHFGRVRIGLKCDDDDGVVKAVQDSAVPTAVLESGAMYFHTASS